MNSSAWTSQSRGYVQAVAQAAYFLWVKSKSPKKAVAGQ